MGLFDILKQGIREMTSGEKFDAKHKTDNKNSGRKPCSAERREMKQTEKGSRNGFGSSHAC